MQSILEDLFMGKIYVMESLPYRERSPVPGEDDLIKSLSAEQQKIYEGILNSVMDRDSLVYQDCFAIGFKMAVRMILEATGDTSPKNPGVKNFHPIP